MKFRKKPVVIEAEQFLPDKTQLPFRDERICCRDGQGWYIETLESQRFHLKTGDWIIKGVRGEFYVIDDSIFKETYEEVQSA